MRPSVIGHIVGELNERLSGGVVSKVHQMDERNVLLKIFSRGSQESLIICAHPRFARIHLTAEEFTNPPAPLRFCAYLRKRITGARIAGFAQVDDEKIVNIALSKLDDGAPEPFTLVAELTGKSSNVILIDGDGIVLDALRRFDIEDALRAVVPGLRLAPLPPAPLHREEEDEIGKEPAISWNEAADRHYSYLIRKDGVELLRSRLRRAVNEARKKAGRKLENLRGDWKKAEEGMVLYRVGELLASNLHRVKRGMEEVVVEDYTKLPAEVVRIPLDARLTPQENVQRCFKRAKKAKKAIELLRDRVPEVEKELEYIGELLYGVEEAETKDDLDSLTGELIEAGYLREAPRTSLIKTAPHKAEPIRRTASSEGFEILCGKSGAGNDLIVKRHAADGDIWLHASGVPGSHVLIKVAGRARELTMRTIEEAAAIAAWHSRNRDAKKAEVIYTEARHVRKPRGAKPGMVTVKEYRTLMAEPREGVHEVKPGSRKR